MTVENFRSFLTQLDASQIDAYLIDRGWVLSEQSFRETVVYTFDFPGEEGHARVSYGSAQNGPQWIDQMYKLVFHLSCVEEREPAAVAHDIARLPRAVAFDWTETDGLRSVLESTLCAVPNSRLSDAQAERFFDRFEPCANRASFLAEGIHDHDSRYSVAPLYAATVLVGAMDIFGEIGTDPDVADRCLVEIALALLEWLQVDHSSTLGGLTDAIRSDQTDAPINTVRKLKAILA